MDAPMGDLDRNAVIGELARAIAAVASGADADARAIVCGLARSWGDGLQQTLPGLPDGQAAPSREMLHRAACSRLFAYWQERCDHAQAKMTPERARAIISRLREGYTEAEVRKAIDGAGAAAYVDETSGRKFDDLTLICRNGSKLESFIERGVTATGAVPVELAANSPVEDRIADMRRKMSELKKAGRDTEYAAAAAALQALMAKRKT